MPKEFFAYPDTRPLFDTLEDIRHRSGQSRGKIFEDVLSATTAALAAETMEAEYFEAIEAYAEGIKGKRAVDLFPVFFAKLVDAMSRTDDDVLGDLFQGAVSYGENGLYLTPESIAKIMAEMTIKPDDLPGDQNVEKERVIVSDPCCGTGRLLMEAGRLHPQAELVGQDIDARCARITAVQLGLRGKYGWVICGNTLSREVQFVYRLGSFFNEGQSGHRRGVIREVAPEECPVLPEITNTTREGLFDALDEKPDKEDATASTSPTILEVPQLLRVELRSHFLLNCGCRDFGGLERGFAELLEFWRMMVSTGLLLTLLTISVVFVALIVSDDRCEMGEACDSNRNDRIGC